MHRCVHAMLLAVLVAALLLSGCGGSGSGGGPPVVPTAPTFTSTPVTAATEGGMYTYRLTATDASGGSVSFALTSAPAGASLSGDTITWTPTTEQSRVANAFTAKVTSSKGGSATQSWTVTPAGTVRVSWIDTFWDENGPANHPFDWTQIPPEIRAAALVPRQDGTMQTLTGVGAADGKLTIADVPGGYYWLRVAPGEMYWTNSSTIDLGADFNASPGLMVIGPGTTTTFNFNVTGIEPAMGGTVQVKIGRAGFMFGSALWGNETSLTASFAVNSNVDWSQEKRAEAYEYKPFTAGSVKGMALGPTAVLTNLNLTSGGTNNIDVPLQPSPTASMDVSIKGSEWEPLFAHVAPGPATPFSTPFALTVDPNISNQFALSGRSVTLLAPLSVSTGSLWNGVGFAISRRSACSMYLSGFVPPIAPPVLLTDENLGAVNYGDPFPETWVRHFDICQQATVDVPDPAGSSTPQKLIVSNGASVAIPTGPVGPMIGPVENPTINDASLFTATTISAPSITLKWSKPSLGEPKGYVIRLLTAVTRPGSEMSAYLTVASLSTTTTSVTLPPELLIPGKTYLLLITSVVDGRANLELSPRRSGMPVAHADIVSAPITIGGAAQ